MVTHGKIPCTSGGVTCPTDFFYFALASYWVASISIKLAESALCTVFDTILLVGSEKVPFPPAGHVRCVRLVLYDFRVCWALPLGNYHFVELVIFPRVTMPVNPLVIWLILVSHFLTGYNFFVQQVIS